MGTHTNQHGQVYEFGITDAQAPVVPGMKVRRIELKSEPEVFAQAQEGEGHTDSVTVTKPDKFMKTATASGYITDLSQYENAAGAGTFNFRGRKYIIRSIAEPRNKGEYVEGSVEAVSFALVQ